MTVLELTGVMAGIGFVCGLSGCLLRRAGHTGYVLAYAILALVLGIGFFYPLMDAAAEKTTGGLALLVGLSIGWFLSESCCSHTAERQ